MLSFKPETPSFMPNLADLDLQTLEKIFLAETKKFLHALDDNLSWEELKTIRRKLKDISILVDQKRNENEKGNSQATG